MTEKWEAACPCCSCPCEQCDRERAEMLAEIARIREQAQRDQWKDYQAQQEKDAEIERLRSQWDAHLPIRLSSAAARSEALEEVAWFVLNDANWKGVTKEQLASDIRALAAKGDEPGTSPKATFATCTCPARHTFDTGEGLNPHWSDCDLTAKGDES